MGLGESPSVRADESSNGNVDDVSVMDEGCVVKRASPSGVGIHVVVGKPLYVEHTD